jgi:hypothetical protein
MADEKLLELRSPFNGGTIAVPPDDPQLPVLLAAGFTRLDVIATTTGKVTIETATPPSKPPKRREDPKHE